MRDLRSLAARSRSSTARALRGARPRRLPHAPGVRRRPRRGVLAARRRRDATRSCTRRAAASSRPSARRVRSTRTASSSASSCTRRWMLAHGTTTWEGKSGYGLDRDTELASLRAVRAAGGSPTWLGAHAVPPEHAGRRRVPRLRARGGAADGGAARGRRRRLPRARRVRRGAGAPVSRGVPRRRARAAAARRPVHRERGDPARDRARRALGRPPRGDRADAGVAALAASDVVGVLLPASALFLDRPMPPARALVDAGAAIALATDFNPGSSFTTSLPLVCSLACTQLHLSPAEALARGDGQRGARARAATDARAGSRRGSRPTSSCSTRPTGATSPTTSRATSSRGDPGRHGRLPALTWRAMPIAQAAPPPREGLPPRVRRRRWSTRRATRSRSPRCARAGARGEGEAARQRRSRPRKTRPARVALREPPPPSWQRAFRRGGMMGGADAARVRLPLQERAARRSASRRASSTPPRSSRSRTGSTAPRTARTSGALGAGKPRRRASRLARRRGSGRRRATARAAAARARRSSLRSACRSSGSKRTIVPGAPVDGLAAGGDLDRRRRAPSPTRSPSPGARRATGRAAGRSAPRARRRRSGGRSDRASRPARRARAESQCCIEQNAVSGPGYTQTLRCRSPSTRFVLGPFQSQLLRRAERARRAPRRR